MVIALQEPSILFWHFINTIAYHLARYKPSSPVSCCIPRFMNKNIKPLVWFKPTDDDDGRFQVVALAKKFIGIHEDLAPLIIELAHESTKSGTPINRPIWWIDPNDEVALDIDSGDMTNP